MRVLVICLLLAGCFSEPEKPSAGVRKERQAKAAVTLGKTPVPRTYRYGNGELQVFEVPSADRLGYVEHQRCFVWRDTEFKSSTISCHENMPFAPLEQPGRD